MKFLPFVVLSLPLAQSQETTESADTNENEYIVLFKQDADFREDIVDDLASAHDETVFEVGASSYVKKIIENDHAVQKRQLGPDYQEPVVNKNLPMTKALAMKLDKTAVAALEAADKVDLVEADDWEGIDQGPMEQQWRYIQRDIGDDVWFLDRLDQNQPSLDHQFHYTATGKGVLIFVLDSGVDDQHEDLIGRVYKGPNFVDGETDADLKGHGTHVAGLAAGRTHGVAKEATIIAVKILNKKGKGKLSSIIKGIEWVTQHATDYSVVNNSWGGRNKEAKNRAFANLAKTNAVVLAAAGNDAKETCEHSPAAIPTTFAVGATNQSDELTDFSNMGKCTDIFAPGFYMYSASAFDNEGNLHHEYRKLNGTSQATPLVAGLAALKISWGLRGHKQVTDALIQDSLKDVIQGDLQGAPNRLAVKVEGRAN